MRDIDRIKPFLKEIEKLWRKYPDWRFNQLVGNIIGYVKPEADIFFVEDDDMFRAIQETMKENEGVFSFQNL